MGDKDPQMSRDGEELRRFTQCLLNDINALEKLLTEGMIESDVCRIGAEQELVLVDRSWRPSLRAMEVLERLNDPHFTTEIAKFNIEINLDPLVFSGDCLSQLEFKLNYYISKASSAAYEFDSEIVLIGILPTIRKSMLTLESMTPLQRYYELNKAFNRMRGKNYELNIKGTDELSLTHDNVMLEASNTSFQVHFQVSPEEFADRYNIAQAAAAPVLAVAVNSPFLGRYRLWRETRIAVFQQSVDIRGDGPLERYRHLSPRVHFGDHWIDHSVLEIFQEDIARHKVLVGCKNYEDPFQVNGRRARTETEGALFT